MKKAKIELSLEQLRLVMRACDFTSRFICGQVETSYWPSEAMHNKALNINDPEWPKIRDEVDALMFQVKKLVWKMDQHASYGVGFNPNSDAMYDIQQVIRHEIWKMNNPNGSERHSVDAYPAHKYGPHPLEEVVIKDETEEETEEPEVK